MSYKIKMICSYCKGQFAEKDGGHKPGLESHGICEDCLPGVLAEIQKAKDRMKMKKQIKDFWLNIDSWDIEQLKEAYQLIGDDIQRTRQNQLQAGLSVFALRSLGQSIQIQENMRKAIIERLKKFHP